MNRIKSIIILSLLLFSTLFHLPAKAQVDPEVSPLILASLDSMVYDYHARNIAFRANANQLNKYNFAEEDVPYYHDSVYRYRLSVLESMIPLDYNHHVKAYIELYCMRKRELSSRIQGLSEYYFPMFEEVFDQQGLPLEFKYLSIVESALNPNAVSRVGATGIWQFMYATALMYDLKITPMVDDRRDPYKATLGAAKYFQHMYNIYGDWLLVIASYNCGPGNVNKAIRRSGGKTTFWEIMPYLPKETRGYVPAFIAATYMMNYGPEHNIYPKEPYFNFPVDTVVVQNSISFDQLSQQLNIPVEDISALNPAYRKQVVPGGGNYKVCLPYRQAMLFHQNREEIYAMVEEQPVTPTSSMTTASAGRVSPVSYTAPKTDSSGAMTYTVSSGETLFSIAQKHSVSVEDIRRWNNMEGSSITKGQDLKIFVPDSLQLARINTARAKEIKRTGRNVPVAKPVYYKIRPGDNLSSIAKKYGTTVSHIQQLNKMKNTRIAAGTTIRVK